MEESMKKLVVIFFVIAVFSSIFAKMEEYSRKSISLFKMDLSSEARLVAEKEDVKYIYDKIFDRLTKEMGRFDYNPIPAGVSDPKELFRIVKEYTETKIEERAAKQWDIKNEYYGTNFITGENVDKILNGAYILFPRIDAFVVTKKKDDEGKVRYTVTEKVSMKVYSAENKGTAENPNWVPKLEKTISASGSNAVSLGALLKLPTGKKGNPRNDALKSATSGMLEFLIKDLKKLDFFKIKALVTKANPKKDAVSFGFGKNVGVKLDDAYTVGYFQKDKYGKEKYVETGYVKVRKIRQSESDSQLLIVNNPRGEKEADLFYEGNQLYEYPLVGLNIVLNGGMGMLKGFDGYDDEGEIEEVPMAPMFGLKAEYNIAKVLQISELYFAIDADLSMPTYQNEDTDFEPELTSFTGEISFLKKFYSRRFAWYLGGGAGYHMVTYKPENEDLDEEDYYSIGGKVFLGFNYLLGKNAFIDLTIGAKFYGELLTEDGDEVFETPDWWLSNEDYPFEGESFLTPAGFYAKIGFGFTL